MKVSLPTGQKKILSGDGWAVFEVLLHGELVLGTGFWILGTGFEGSRLRVAPQLLRNKRDLRFASTG